MRLSFFKKSAILALMFSASSLLAEVSSTTVFLDKQKTSEKSCDQRVRRAVFDISGSGIRVLVADVDLETKKVEKLFNAKVDIGFRKDLMQNLDKKEFSKEIQSYAQAVFQHLQELTAKYQPQQSYAIAADAFLMADNGKFMLDNLSNACGVCIHVVSQKEKGELEFLTGVVNCNTNAERTIVIDMCSANAHVTALNADGSFISFNKKLGYGVIDDYIAKKVRNLEKTPQDINPVTTIEGLLTINYLSAQFDEMPDSLKAKFATEDLSVIATFTPIVGEKVWKAVDAWDFLCENVLEHASQDPFSPLMTSKALFIYTLVEKMNIAECTLIGTDVREGSAAGVLLVDKFWSVDK